MQVLLLPFRSVLTGRVTGDIPGDMGASHRGEVLEGIDYTFTPPLVDEETFWKVQRADERQRDAIARR